MPAQKRPDAENKAAIDKNQGIKFDKISFSYHDGTEVLHNISFETRLGEVTALVGPSGGGKSTIAIDAAAQGTSAVDDNHSDLLLRAGGLEAIDGCHA